MPVVNGRPEIEFANMTQLLRRSGRNRDEFANMAQANDMTAGQAQCRVMCRGPRERACGGNAYEKTGLRIEFGTPVGG